MYLSHVAPSVVGTSFNREGHDLRETLQPQVQPGFLTKKELREDKAMVALEGRYHSEPFIGKSDTAFSKFPPGPSGVKQRRAMINNEGNLQLGDLNRECSPQPYLTELKTSQEHLVAEKLSSNTGMSTTGERRDERITTQSVPPESKQPVEVQQGVWPTHLSPSDDGSHGKGPQGSSGGGRPPGQGGPPGRGELLGDGPQEHPGRRGPTQRSPSRGGHEPITTQPTPLEFNHPCGYSVVHTS